MFGGMVPHLHSLYIPGFVFYVGFSRLSNFPLVRSSSNAYNGAPGILDLGACFLVYCAASPHACRIFCRRMHFPWLRIFWLRRDISCWGPILFYRHILFGIFLVQCLISLVLRLIQVLPGASFLSWWGYLSQRLS